MCLPAVAIPAIFPLPRKRRTQLAIRRKRGRARRIAMQVLFVLARPQPWSLAVGAVLIFLGWLVNVTTYGVLVKRKVLITGGPYAFCRNPFYFGTLLSDLGILIAANPLHIPAAVACGAYAAVQITFYVLQVRREEKHLLEIHGEAYREYCRVVRNRLLPAPLAGIRRGGLRFEWSFDLALKNKVFSRAAGALIWPILLLGIYLWGSGELWLFGAMLFGESGSLTGLIAVKWYVPTLVAALLVWAMFRMVEAAHAEEAGRIDAATDGA